MNKLTPFFKEIIEVRWSQFCKMEKEEEHTSAQGIVFAIIRACVNGKLPAIKESLNRIDGKLAEQIEVIYPKFYITYPYATAIEATVRTPEGKEITVPQLTGSDTPPDPERPLVTGSLRDTLTRMSEEPKTLVTALLAAAKDVELRESYSGEVDPVNDPLVKSVIVAGLLRMAHNGNLGAIFEVFDNIDGKLVDTIRVLGEDIYLNSYDTIAPRSAVKINGVYRVEADNATNNWAISLGKKGGDNGSDKR